MCKEDGVTHTATWQKFQISNFLTIFSSLGYKKQPQKLHQYLKRYGKIRSLNYGLNSSLDHTMTTPNSAMHIAQITPTCTTPHPHSPPTNTFIATSKPANFSVCGIRKCCRWRGRNGGGTCVLYSTLVYAFVSQCNSFRTACVARIWPVA